jgi:hypothetical protein
MFLEEGSRSFDFQATKPDILDHGDDIWPVS